MTFELRVEFSGLCVYLMHPDNQHIGVMMTDARVRADPRHADTSVGKAHVGYLRFNVANVIAGLPGGDTLFGPAYEIVHRFDREVLDLGLPLDGQSVHGTPGMPEFVEFAPGLELVPATFADAAPPSVSMRLLLRGGSLTPMGKQKLWQFSDTLNPGKPLYSGQFASVVRWSRTIDSDHLDITIRSFVGANKTTWRLMPTDIGDGPLVTIKIANLCAENPLEWPELETPFVAGDDVDFKWLYRLYQPTQGVLSQLLQGEPLPVPTPVKPVPFGTQGCMGAQTRKQFDPAAFTA